MRLPYSVAICAAIFATVFTLTAHDARETPKPPDPHIAYTPPRFEAILPESTPTAAPPASISPAPIIETALGDLVARTVYLETLPTPTPVPVVIAASAGSVSPSSGYLWDEDPACLANSDRYEWQAYAVAAGFPVWAMEELAFVVSRESGGDLCAVNNSSGATCWIQQHPGGPQFLDPTTCMAQGFSKWLDGGQSFERHWYRFWP